MLLVVIASAVLQLASRRNALDDVRQEVRPTLEAFELLRLIHRDDAQAAQADHGLEGAEVDVIVVGELRRVADVEHNEEVTEVG